MRTETYTITKTYYSYDELSDTAKEKVKQWYIDDPLRNDFLYDDITLDLRQIFPASELDVIYQLCYCQGDGLSMTGRIDWTDMLDAPAKVGKAGFWNNYTEKEQRRLKWYLPKMSDYYLRNRYTRDVNSIMYLHIGDAGEIARDYAEEITTYYGWRDVDARIIKRFLVDAFGLLETLESEYAEHGYKFLYEPDEDEISEMCEVNGWEFDENGKTI